MIELKNISKSYGERTILQKVNLTVSEGEMVAIIGKSGSGKSTLLNILGFIDTFDEGEYRFLEHQNVAINTSQSQKIIREHISYLFQNYALIDNATVENNLMLALHYTKMSKQEKRQLISQELSKVGLDNFGQRKVYELSGGEQQRLAVVRAMIKPNRLILADEPTGSLDGVNRSDIMELLCEINRSGTTIVLVTHDLEVAKLCDKIYMIEQQTLVMQEN